MEFLAPLLEKNATGLAFTTNTLIDNLEREVCERSAELYLIRDRIQELLTGDYMPTSHALLAALWPTMEHIGFQAEQMIHHRGIHSQSSADQR